MPLPPRLLGPRANPRHALHGARSTAAASLSLSAPHPRNVRASASHPPGIPSPHFAFPPIVARAPHKAACGTPVAQTGTPHPMSHRAFLPRCSALGNGSI